MRVHQTAEPERYRDEQSQPPMNGIIWLLAALLLVIIPHLFRLPIWISVSCLTLLGWRILAEYHRWPLPSALIKLVITLSLVAATYLQFFTFNGLLPGSALLTIMLCLKLLEMRCIRDAMVMVFLGYFLVTASFLFDQSILSGLYLFTVVFALTTTLIILNHPLASTANQRHYLSLTSSLLLQAIPLMLILFILFPRVSGPLWMLPNNQTSAKTGLSDSLRLGEITHLAESHDVAFRVKFDETPPPPADQLYWRGPVLSHTDGRNWQDLSQQSALRKLPPKHQSQFFGNAINYTVTLQPHKQSWVFALDLPANIPNNISQRFDYQLIAKDQVDNVMRYSIHSYPQYMTGEPWPLALSTALQLPPEHNPKTQAQAQQWVQRGLTPNQIVDQALELFRQQPFYYSRTPPTLTSNDPVDEFLFTTKRGFCEHYAASFVTLMRAASIPARIVTGYQGGEFNPMGNYLIVRQSNAHAWAEVWLSSQGWVRVDPTVVIPTERIETHLDTQRFQTTRANALTAQQSDWLTQKTYWLRSSWDATNHQWNQWILGYDNNKQQQFLQKLGLYDLSIKQLLLMLLLSVATIITGVMSYLLYHSTRSKDPIIAGYQRFCKKLAKVGIKHQPSQGPHTFCELACKKLPHLNQQITTITQCYVALRYRPGRSRHLQQFLRLVDQFNPHKN